MIKKRNLKYRELVLAILFCDIILTYVLNYVGINVLDINDYGVINGISVFVHIIIDWLCMFFIWVPVRYEKYNEKNPHTFFLAWAILSIIIFVVLQRFMYQGNVKGFCLGILIYMAIYSYIREIIISRHNESEEKILAQTIKDLPTCVTLIGIYPIVNIINLVIYYSALDKLCLILIRISFVVSLVYIFYCFRLRKFICKKATDKKSKWLVFLYIIGLHIYYMLSGLLLRNVGQEEKVISIAIFIIISILLNMLYVNGLNSNLGANCTRGVINDNNKD